MNVFHNNKKYAIYSYANEDEFEQEIVGLSKNFFGEKTIYIDAKRKIESKTLGGTIPDGFFFDFSDNTYPQFFLVEVELASHSFFNHIFPQITKFFAFYKNHSQQKKLVEKLFAIIDSDPSLKEEFTRLAGASEIYKFLNDTVDSSQNILLIVDGEKKELPEIIDTYTDTWGRMVKPMVIQKYINGTDCIYTMTPEYDALEYVQPQSIEENDVVAEVSEDVRLEVSNEKIKNVYHELKNKCLQQDSSFIFNPQKYYISIKSSKNIAYLFMRKKKIQIVVMLPENRIREKINFHHIKTLSDSVQNFYNGECSSVVVESDGNLDEVIDIIIEARDAVCI